VLQAAKQKLFVIKRSNKCYDEPLSCLKPTTLNFYTRNKKRTDCKLRSSHKKSSKFSDHQQIRASLQILAVGTQDIFFISIVLTPGVLVSCAEQSHTFYSLCYISSCIGIPDINNVSVVLECAYFTQRAALPIPKGIQKVAQSFQITTFQNFRK
jgi:hypothetical protein